MEGRVRNLDFLASGRLERGREREKERDKTGREGSQRWRERAGEKHR